MTDHRPGPVLAALLLADAALPLAVLLVEPSPSTGLNLLLFVVAAALALLAWRAWVRPTTTVVALVRGLAVLGILVAAVLFLLSWAGAAMADDPGHAWAMLPWCGAFALLQVLTLVQSQKVAKTGLVAFVATSAAGAGAIWIGGAVAFVVLAGAWHLLTGAIEGRRLAVGDRMRAAARQVQMCAWAYAKANPRRGYPAHLADLGPDGSACLSADVARNSVRGVRLEYVAGAPDDGGYRDGFRLTAKANAGTHGEQHTITADQSGWASLTRPEFTSPMRTQYLRDGLDELRNLRACAEVFRARFPDEGYPANLSMLARLRGPDEGRALRLGCSPVPLASPDLVLNKDPHASRLLYHAVEDSTGMRSDYEVRVRPDIYPDQAVRSYFATANSHIFYTLENREASDADSVLADCEYEPFDGTCGPPPGGRDAMVRVTAPDTVALDTPFVVTIEDLRPPELVDAPYEAVIVCGAPLASKELDEPPTRWESFATAQECVLDDQTVMRYPNFTVVRAWFRDRASTISVVDDTVHVSR